MSRTTAQRILEQEILLSDKSCHYDELCHRAPIAREYFEAKTEALLAERVVSRMTWGDVGERELNGCCGWPPWRRAS